MFRGSHQRCSVKKHVGVTGKHLRWSLFLIKLFVGDSNTGVFLHEHWAFRYKKSYLNETAKGIEHKIQEKSKQNRIIKYKQIRIEFCYTWVGIHKVCLGYAYAFAMFLFRGASRTAATYKMEREAVNYYHKALHLGCCSSPRSASEPND